MSTRSNQQPDSKHSIVDFYKDVIIFRQNQGMWYVKGEHVKMMCSLLNLSYEGNLVGLDEALSSQYAMELIRKGAKVGYSIGGDEDPNIIRMLKANTSKTQPKPRPRIESTTIGISPELLVGQKELARWMRSKQMNKPSTKDLIDTIKEYLVTNNTRAIADYGTLFVYRLGHDMYEIDELTTVPWSVLEALLVAAYQTGRMIKCELVEPKGRRKRGRKPQRVQITLSEPVEYGQLSLEL